MAKVSLLKTHIYDPHCDKEDNDFHPWIQLTNAVSAVPFCVVNHKSDLEQALRMAQKAILTPNRDPSEFIGPSPPTGDILAPFSPNVVVIHIRGSGLPNLSFVDLPGVISQSDDGPHVVNLVEQLARMYARQPNTIVLQATSMENDMMNSRAAALVKEEAEERCLGVLTKPDRLAQDSDSAEQWREVLSGTKFKRGFGYFVTKQPAQSELKKCIEHQEARTQEMEFFSSPRWTLLFSGFTDQLGTNKLANALSQHLVKLIQRQLPFIQEKVQDRLDDITKRLAELPEPSNNPLYEVSRILREYALLSNTLVSKDEHDRNLVRQQVMELLKHFQAHIFENLRPKFLPKLDLELDLKRKSTAGPPVRNNCSTPKRRCQNQEVGLLPNSASTSRCQHLSPGDDVVFVRESPKTPKAPTTPRFQNGLILPERPSSGGKHLVSHTTVALYHQISPIVGFIFYHNSRSTPSYLLCPNYSTANSLLGPAFSCGQLKFEIDKYQVPGLPGEVNPNGLNTLIMSTVQNWEGPINDLMKSVGSYIRSSLLKLVSSQEVCGGYPGSTLHLRMLEFTSDFVREIVLAERNKALEAAQREGICVTTLDEKHYDSIKDSEHEILRTYRYNWRAEAHYARLHGQGPAENPFDQTERNKWEEARRKIVCKEAFKAEVGEDPYAREVEVVAKIKAYYRIASTRMVENVSIMVEAGILRRLGNFVEELEQHLDFHGGHSLNHWAGYLEQDPERAEERIRLTAQAEALEKAYHELEQCTGFGNNSYEVEMEDAL